MSFQLLTLVPWKMSQSKKKRSQKHPGSPDYVEGNTMLRPHIFLPPVLLLIGPLKSINYGERPAPSPFQSRGADDPPADSTLKHKGRWSNRQRYDVTVDEHSGHSFVTVGGRFIDFIFQFFFRKLSTICYSLLGKNFFKIIIRQSSKISDRSKECNHPHGMQYSGSRPQTSFFFSFFEMREDGIRKRLEICWRKVNVTSAHIY